MLEISIGFALSRSIDIAEFTYRGCGQFSQLRGPLAQEFLHKSYQ